MLKRDEKLLNNNFLVSFNLEIYGFSKVTNIQSSVELETIQEGGSNDGPAIRLKPKSALDTIVLEKGISSGQQKSSLKVGQGISSGLIMVMKNGMIQKTYGFEYGVITKITAGDLDALGNQVLVERVEITHTGLITM